MLNPLFLLPPEIAHKVALCGVRHGFVKPYKRSKSLEKELCGIRFPSPVGLSAGADKEAYALQGWDKVGFGFVETGTVTLNPRAGNPKPRIWRQKQEQSIINWMGLPGGGLKPFLDNIKMFRQNHPRSDLVIGVSIASPDGDVEELETLTREIAPYADYFTLNASCPNVEHGDDGIQTILSQIEAVCAKAGSKPLFLKLAPTNDKASLETVLLKALKAGARGFVLTNTVPAGSKALLGDIPFDWPTYQGQNVGGYSGPRLLETTRFMISTAREIVGEQVPLIAVGGIQSADDAKHLVKAGADLIQLYTGFIYKGPQLIRALNNSFI